MRKTRKVFKIILTLFLIATLTMTTFASGDDIPIERASYPIIKTQVGPESLSKY